jgi:hypothetical protein
MLAGSGSGKGSLASLQKSRSGSAFMQTVYSLLLTTRLPFSYYSPNAL